MKFFVMKYLLRYHSSKHIGIAAVQRCRFDQYGIKRKLKEFWMNEATREHIESLDDRICP